ncbi:MAG: hypothetical protein ACOY3J_13405, partial [Bacillota bacterium]
MKSIQDISRIIIEIEDKHKLFDIYINGIPFWWFVRVKLINMLYRQSNHIAVSAGTAEALSTRELLLKLKDSFHLNITRQHRVLAVSTSSARREIVEGKDFDIFFDFLSWTNCADSYAVLETPDRISHSKQPYSPFRYYGDQIILWGNLYRKAPLLVVNKKVDQQLSHISRRVSSALGHSGILLPWEEILTLMRKEFAFASVAIRISSGILNEIQPQFLLVEDGYSPSHMAIQLAAKKRGVPVIELQHGLIVPDNYSYKFGIQDVGQLRNSPFPDKLWVYGEHFKEVLQQNRFLRSEDIVVIGNPYLWYKLNRMKDRKQQGNKILIAAQPEYSAFFTKLTLELSRLVENDIILKPHPSEIPRAREIYKDLIGNKKVTLVTSNIPIYELFCQSAFHIAVGSMTHLEALCFGIKDIIIRKGGFDRYFTFLMEKGIPAVEDIAEIVDVIRSYPDISQVSSYVRNQVFNINENPLASVET